MSRLKPQIVEENNADKELTLDELIPQYALNKSEADAYKKLCDRDNAKIKDIMLKADEKKHEAGDYVATVTVSERATMNEEMLLSLFTSVPSFVSACAKYNIVKTKEYIDFDALENAIYNDGLSDEQLAEIAKAKEVKEVVTLKVSKKKEKKEK